MRRWLPGVVMLAIGAASAGGGPDAGASAQAWWATYRLHDAHGVRDLVLLCDDDTVEMRVAGEPVRIWERRPDGIEHRVVFAAEHRGVTFAPGDLRATGRQPDWARVRGLVPDAQRPAPAAPHRLIDGCDVQWRDVADAQTRVDVAWLPNAGLPARYVRRGAQPLRLELRELRRVPASGAFTTMEGIREMDAADIGDESLDPFARRFILQGF